MSDVKRLKKWLIGWGCAGLFGPVLYLAVHFIASYELFIFPLWPGSFFLMALGGQPPSVARVLQFWLVAILSNVLLYAMIGSLLWPLARLKSKTPWDDEQK